MPVIVHRLLLCGHPILHNLLCNLYNYWSNVGHGWWIAYQMICLPTVKEGTKHCTVFRNYVRFLHDLIKTRVVSYEKYNPLYINVRF